MITRIKIEGFKSLASVDLQLGHFNLFVGTNASGKSNFFDALRVLQGIGYGFTISEILNGKPKSAGSEVWEGIRGGSALAGFVPRGSVDPTPKAVEFAVSLTSLENLPQVNVVYTIGFLPQNGHMQSESLKVGNTTIFDSSPVGNSSESPHFIVRYYGGKRGRQHPWFEHSRPVLHQLAEKKECKPEHAKLLQSCAIALRNMQRLDPSPLVLRGYSQASEVMRMGERGENFAALVNVIQSDAERKAAYLEWLRALTPAEIDDVDLLRGALKEPLFAVRQNGTTWPAPVLSDGTLRFAAIAAAFFQTDMPNILTIEEIENSIHPTRLRLLLELLRSQSSGQLQVFATTHSPVLLAWLQESDYATTFFCQRDEESGASRITPLTEIPRLLELLRNSSLGELFTQGWLEDA